MTFKTIKKHLVDIYALICFAITIIRINNNSFWGDEAWTIFFSKMSVLGFVKGTASDVHPPLYYFIVWLFTRVLGYEAYVYRLVSVVAFVLMLAIALVFIKKNYGQCATFLFITFLSFLSAPSVQNLEARMYSWAILFVCMSYILLKRIFEVNELKYYTLFALFVLSSAYTHYYALVSVGFLCAGLFIYALIHKEYLKSTLLAGVSIIILYAPWMIVLLRTFKKTKEDYWIPTIPTITECLRFLFKSKNILEIILLVVWLIVLVAYILCRTSVGSILKNVMSCSPEANDIWWVMIGFAAVVMTAVTGIGVSEIFRPMFQTKYMYPCAAVAWIVLIECISKIRKQEYIFIVLSVLSFLLCIGGYTRLVKSDKSDHMHVQATMAEINKQIENDDLVIIENDCTSYKILLYYCPNNENVEVMDVADYDFEKSEYDDFWIVTDLRYEDDKIKSVKDMGLENIELFISDGMIGNKTVNVYHCNK